jgi:hypothetical protein
MREDIVDEQTAGGKFEKITLHFLEQAFGLLDLKCAPKFGQ